VFGLSVFGFLREGAGCLGLIFNTFYCVVRWAERGGGEANFPVLEFLLLSVDSCSVKSLSDPQFDIFNFSPCVQDMLLKFDALYHNYYRDSHRC
jgi:hypothetical protein